MTWLVAASTCDSLQWHKLFRSCYPLVCCQLPVVRSLTEARYHSLFRSSKKFITTKRHVLFSNYFYRAEHENITITINLGPKTNLIYKLCRWKDDVGQVFAFNQLVPSWNSHLISLPSTYPSSHIKQRGSQELSGDKQEEKYPFDSTASLFFTVVLKSAIHAALKTYPNGLRKHFRPPKSTLQASTL